MSYFTSFMQKAFCAAADQSAAAGFACGSFRITMDAVLCAVSIFAILGVVGGVLAALLLLAGVLLIMLARIIRAGAPKRRLLTI